MPKELQAKEKKRDYSYTQNREVSWLRFNKRVLEEALDPSVPLFERMKFCAIFQSNLDEWFMIRVGGLSSLSSLKKEPTDNKSGMTPTQQLATIFNTVPDLLAMHEDAFFKTEKALKKEGLIRVSPEDFDSADTQAAKDYFEKHLAPILSPLVIDPRHPFPNLRNGLLYIACELRSKEGEHVLGIVEIPPVVKRIVPLPTHHSALQQTSTNEAKDLKAAAGSKKPKKSKNVQAAQGTQNKRKKSADLTNEKFRFSLVEDVIAQNIYSSFGNFTPLATSVVRVTRNADLDPDGEGVGEEDDYRLHMIKVLKKRMRLEPVRAVFQGYLGKRFEEMIAEELHLTPERIQHIEMPLELSYVYNLERHMSAAQKAKLLFKPFQPQETPMIDPSLPVKDQVLDHDVLLSYPYESMRPLLNLLHDAAHDENCISIRITLYRVAKESRLCENLIAAAEAGKDVTVLMELRARFDEENNIEWAERLEEAGCTVIYGFEGFKCHSKICQIVYHVQGKLQYITCLGTGNFNEKTARLYSDFMLLTAHKGIGKDGVRFFKNLMTGKLTGHYNFLGVAPVGLKPLVMEGIDREIARANKGKDARVFLKMNSLTDRDVIGKLREASTAGVEVIMVVRGICCILPGIKGETKNIKVHQIVGRFLEHSRIYAFGTKYDIIYLSSADMMTRNTERRVEIAYPVLDETCKKIVVEYIRLQKKDNVKGRELTSVGTWEKLRVKPDKPLINSQEIMLALAYLNAQLHPEKSKLRKDPYLEGLPEAVLKRLIKLNTRYKGNIIGSQRQIEEVSELSYATNPPLPESSYPKKSAQRAEETGQNEPFTKREKESMYVADMNLGNMNSADMNLGRRNEKNTSFNASSISSKEPLPFIPKDVQIAEDTVGGDIPLENAEKPVIDSSETTGRLWSTGEVKVALSRKKSKAYGGREESESKNQEESKAGRQIRQNDNEESQKRLDAAYEPGGKGRVSEAFSLFKKACKILFR